MVDKIETIINNMLLIDKQDFGKKINGILKEIKQALENNKEAILKANKIDLKNENGFLIDFEIINKILGNASEETIWYGKVICSQRDIDKKIIYGKQIMDIGNVVVITDGNPYVLIEMMIRNILAGNTTIFANNGFMYGVNQLLVQIIQEVLEQFKISKELVQIYVTQNYDEILNNYANIDLVVVIGNWELQRLIIEKSKIKTITSGYENFEIYVENQKHNEFIKKIMKTGLNVQVYMREDLKLDYPDVLLVVDLEEAIAKINYNGSRYSTAIFTESPDNAAKFIREIKAKIVTVNASPTIERLIDIKQTDLVCEKTIIYPLSNKFNKDVYMVNLNKE